VLSQYRVKTRFWPLLAVLVVPALCSADVSRGVVPENGLKYWEWRGEGALFRLTQRLPDQTRAFFLARGFSASDADFIARQCVFQSMLQNVAEAGTGPLTYDLDAWRVHDGEHANALLTREHWDRLWQDRNVAPAQRIAFEWSLLPTEQSYLSGDYNWGMTSYGLKPGTRFDLVFSWKMRGKQHTGRIDGIECPEDRHPEPAS
jgi:hypothetical protein